MATTTVNLLTALSATPADGDHVPIWDTSAAAYKRVTVANLLGGTSQLGTAQTYSALKTFSAGITFGDDTLDQYVEGTWTPTITAATTSPTLTYTTQSGSYTRIGNIVYYDAIITINTLSAGGTGEWRFSVPVACARTMLGVVNFVGVDLAANTVSLYFRAVGGNTYGVARAIIDDGGPGTLGGSAFASGDTIQYTGFYFV